MSKIPNVKFRDDSLDTILAGVGMDQVKKICFDKFIPNFKLAIDKNKKECVFCTTDDFQIIIPKSSYKNVLKVLEEYYIKNENYEMCAQLVEMFEKIKE